MKCAIIATFAAVAAAVPFNSGLFADGDFHTGFDTHVDSSEHTSRNWDNKEDLHDIHSKDHGSELLESSQHVVDKHDKKDEHLIHDIIELEDGGSASSLDHKKSSESKNHSDMIEKHHSKDFGSEERDIESSKSSAKSEEATKELLAAIGLSIDADGKIACGDECMEALVGLIGQF